MNCYDFTHNNLNYFEYFKENMLIWVAHEMGLFNLINLGLYQGIGSITE